MSKGVSLLSRSPSKKINKTTAEFEFLTYDETNKDIFSKNLISTKIVLLVASWIIVFLHCPFDLFCTLLLDHLRINKVSQ